ncbi:MAG: DUF1460 domain-containing protein [Thermodesulfovibrionales bacterium]|nr:DUF1460 domain-containing protein [Thermodesulfovibrionales bacterium]
MYRGIALKLAIFFFILIFINTSTTMAEEYIDTGKWTIEQIDLHISNSKNLAYQDRVDYFSNLFIGIPYNDKTLLGSKDKEEIFVINFREVDCFTYIDYVFALSISSNFIEFKDNLKKIRYKKGKLDFLNRRHFFTDWSYSEPTYVEDITHKIGQDNVKRETKNLNYKTKTNRYLKGLPLVKRVVQFIPSHLVNQTILDNLQTGDYIGIFSNEKGLDVSHVGILIKKTQNKVLFRHASSLKSKVVEEDFLKYISKKPGIVVLRMKN